VTKAHYDLKNMILLKTNRIINSMLGTPERKSHILFFVFLYIRTPNSTETAVIARYKGINKKDMLKCSEKSGHLKLSKMFLKILNILKGLSIIVITSSK